MNLGDTKVQPGTESVPWLTHHMAAPWGGCCLTPRATSPGSASPSPRSWSLLVTGGPAQRKFIWAIAALSTIEILVGTGGQGVLVGKGGLPSRFTHSVYYLEDSQGAAGRPGPEGASSHG